MSVHVFYDCAQRVVHVEEAHAYGQHIDAASAAARDQDGRPVGFSIEPHASLIGRECTIEVGDTTAQGRCLALAADSATLLQDGRVTVVRGYDGILEDEESQGGTARVDEPCTFWYTTNDLRWECVCTASVSDQRCSLVFSALIHNASGGPVEGEVFCIAAALAGPFATEDAVGYSLGARSLPRLSSHLLLTTTMDVTRYYSYTVGRAGVRTGYLGQAPEFLPKALVQVQRDGRALGSVPLEETRAGEAVRLDMGLSSVVAVEETNSSSATHAAAQLKMHNRGACEALLEVYLQGKWEDVLPQGHHDEGGRLRWMVLLPPRSTKTLTCKAKKVV